jgi:hypothetical protein
LAPSSGCEDADAESARSQVEEAVVHRIERTVMRELEQDGFCMVDVLDLDYIAAH